MSTPGSAARRYDLAKALVTRDILGRYRGSSIGLAWTFLVPLLMLGIYTFVFGSIFQARWDDSVGEGGGGTLDFALLLFIGLMLHSFMTEIFMRAPSIIISNTNIVKKVVFPLEILPLMTVLTSLFHFFVSFAVFLAFFALVKGTIHPTVLWLPIVIAPLAVLLAGCAWVLAGLSVYYRDIGHLMGFVATVLLFLSPIFYPASRLPEHLRPLFQINPLTFIIEQSRAIAFTGIAPDFLGLAIYAVFAVAVAVAGRKLFELMRRGFSDVL